MGLLGLLIGAILLILFFVYFYFSNSPTTIITPKESGRIQTQAQDAINSEMEKNKLEQNQIENIDLP